MYIYHIKETMVEKKIKAIKRAKADAIIWDYTGVWNSMTVDSMFTYIMHRYIKQTSKNKDSVNVIKEIGNNFEDYTTILLRHVERIAQLRQGKATLLEKAKDQNDIDKLIRYDANIYYTELFAVVMNYLVKETIEYAIDNKIADIIKKTNGKSVLEEDPDINHIPWIVNDMAAYIFQWHSIITGKEEEKGRNLFSKIGDIMPFEPFQQALNDLRGFLQWRTDWTVEHTKWKELTKELRKELAEQISEEALVEAKKIFERNIVDPINDMYKQEDLSTKEQKTNG